MQEGTTHSRTVRREVRVLALGAGIRLSLWPQSTTHPRLFNRSIHMRTRNLLLIPALLLSGCDLLTGSSAGGPSWTAIPLDERVTDAYTGFGFELFRRLQQENPSGNIFVSPTSAAFALAMTYNGAVGATAEEMALALGVGHLDLATLNATTRTWLASLRQTGDPRAELELANSIWYRPDWRIRDSFRQQVTTHYDAEIAELKDAATINRWVEKATRGRIDEIITGEVPGNVVAYLINALYFKADWTTQFRESDTRSAPFRRPDGSVVTVPMMTQKGPFEVRNDPAMEMLRLPYGNGRFSMVLALPHHDASVMAIAEQLEPSRWKSWMSQFAEVPLLEIGLPRFEIEWESSLVESLAAMGMKVPFDDQRADFSGMFERRGPWIGDVLQKTYVRVDEKGTEAAAVTKVAMVESANPGIIFDRAFFLAIYDHATETVLFLGQITDPTG
jgi:serine protease inhibitor